MQDHWSEMQELHPTDNRTIRNAYADASSFTPHANSLSYSTQENSDNGQYEKSKELQESTMYFEKQGYAISLVGLVITLVCGLGIFALGVYLRTSSAVLHDDIKNSESPGVLVAVFSDEVRTVVNLFLNVLITICTETVGSIHSTTLRWALAKEGKLDFNANLRLFSSAGRWWCSPFGIVANLLYAVCLTFSYVSASMIFVPIAIDAHYSGKQAVSYVPTTILGVSLLIQGILALASFILVDVPTWSNSCFDVAAAALQRGYVRRVPNRCMRSIGDLKNMEDSSPVRPSQLQTSMWNAHKSVKAVMLLVWGLLPAALLWTIIVIALFKLLPFSRHAAIGHLDWNLVPHVGARGNETQHDGALALALGWPFNPVHADGTSVWGGTLPTASFLVYMVTIAAIQGCLTVGLTCCELIVSLGRDESNWRDAGSAKGTCPTPNPLKNALINWQSVSLLVLTPVLHWLFGNCIGILAGYGLYMLPVQLFYLFLGTIIVALWATFVSRRPIVGMQPAAYGHIQTLVNLVDNWERSPQETHSGWWATLTRALQFWKPNTGGRLYWGDKSSALSEDRPAVSHAGTSTAPLPNVHDNVLYA